MEFLMPPHPLTNFEIKEYCQNEPRFNGVFFQEIICRKKTKNGAYVINFVKEMELFILIVLVLNTFQEC